MANFMDSVKEIFTTSKNAVVRTFNRAKKASSYKLNEMDVTARRRDAISELGEKVYSLAQAEVALPEELVELIDVIRAMDDGLVNARKEHEEWKKTTAEQVEAEKAQLEEQRKIRAEELEQKRAEARAQAEARRAEAQQRAEEQKRLKEEQKNARVAANQGSSTAEQAALERAAAMKAAAEAAAAAEEQMANSAKYPADSE